MIIIRDHDSMTVVKKYINTKGSQGYNYSMTVIKYFTIFSNKFSRVITIVSLDQGDVEVVNNLYILFHKSRLIG